MLRLMIADDDPSMRLILRKAVETMQGIELVAQAKTGNEAISIVAKETIDVAFLDVDMPGLNGVEVAKLVVDINPKCAIIFITAHEDYMKDAFELFAFDYIMKPFKLERLHKTIHKLIEQKTQFMQRAKVTSDLISEDLMLKVKDGMVIVKKEDIILIEREDRQTVVITKSGEFALNKSLQDMEAILDDSAFIRSHKSYIIRIDAIESMQVYGRWTYIVKLKGTKHDALLTKEKAKALETKFVSFE